MIRVDVPLPSVAWRASSSHTVPEVGIVASEILLD